MMKMTESRLEVAKIDLTAYIAIRAKYSVTHLNGHCEDPLLETSFGFLKRDGCGCCG